MIYTCWFGDGPLEPDRARCVQQSMEIPWPKAAAEGFAERYWDIMEIPWPKAAAEGFAERYWDIWVRTACESNLGNTWRIVSVCTEGHDVIERFRVEKTVQFAYTAEPIDMPSS